MSLPLGLPHHLRSQQDHESQTMSFNLNEFNVSSFFLVYLLLASFNLFFSFIVSYP